MRSVAIGAFCWICLLGCGDGDVPKGILQPEKMQAVMWDVLQAEVFASEFIRVDTTKNTLYENFRLQKKIFSLHQTSREQYYKSYEYYKSKPELMKTMLDTMVVRVNRSRNRVDNPSSPLRNNDK
jgi:hypothetical protein